MIEYIKMYFIICIHMIRAVVGEYLDYDFGYIFKSGTDNKKDIIISLHGSWNNWERGHSSSLLQNDNGYFAYASVFLPKEGDYEYKWRLDYYDSNFKHNITVWINDHSNDRRIIASKYGNHVLNTSDPRLYSLSHFPTYGLTLLYPIPYSNLVTHLLYFENKDKCSICLGSMTDIPFYEKKYCVNKHSIHNECHKYYFSDFSRLHNEAGLMNSCSKCPVCEGKFIK